MSKSPERYARAQRERSHIKLHRGSAVRVHCPNGVERKHPAFHRAFHGRKGSVLQIEPNGAQGVILVDVSTQSEPGCWINLPRDWLAHNDGRQHA